MFANRRKIFVYDFVIKTRSTHAPVPKLEEIAAILNRKFLTQKCSHTRDKGSLVFRIGDLKIDSEKNILNLLVRKADKNSADPAFSDMDTGELEIISKKSTQGGDVGTHLSISLIPEKNKPDTYLMLIESAPGISHRPIKALLNFLIKEALKEDKSSFQYKNPGSKKTSTFTPVVEINGHPSNQLVEDLERGRVQHVNLSYSNLKTPLGGNAYLSEYQYSLVLKASPGIPSQGRIKYLKDSVKGFIDKGVSKNFESARVHFETVDGVDKHFDYDLETGAIKEDKYVKSFYLDEINPPLPQSFRLMSDKICSMMSDILERERSI